MTEPAHPTADHGNMTVKLLTPPQLADSPDPLLIDLVRLADTLNVEHGIALTIGGSLISGTLISGYRFFEGQASAASAGSVIGSANPQAAQAYQDRMVEFYRSRMRLCAPDRLAAEGAAYVPGIIHLHNAQFIGNDGMFTGESQFWRGRLVTVSGFSIRQV